jgi:hypothetical protein
MKIEVDAKLYRPRLRVGTEWAFDIVHFYSREEIVLLRTCKKHLSLYVGIREKEQLAIVLLLFMLARRQNVRKK